MRRGDFSVELVPVNADNIREVDSGHVLARPGAVYAIRLRNLGPLRAVTAIEIDGRRITGGGLVLDAYGVVTLERPVDGPDSGRFTVVAEGDERVFGPDGGRDNAELGLIEASFQRELPNERNRSYSMPELPWSHLNRVTEAPPARPLPPSRIPPRFLGFRDALAAREAPVAPARDLDEASVERAAGTGLTGHSDQSFIPITLGPLEHEATVITLRLVIGSEEALVAPRPLHADGAQAPVRPAARP
ncbi:MAG: hypothetical protein ACHQWU_11485 [Gemmatimonadales bacterium]